MSQKLKGKKEQIMVTFSKYQLLLQLVDKVDVENFWQQIKSIWNKTYRSTLNSRMGKKNFA